MTTISDSKLSLLKANLERENMQKAATLFEEAAQHIPHSLLAPLHTAIETMHNRSDVDEEKKVILDFYLDHLQFKKVE